MPHRNVIRHGTPVANAAPYSLRCQVYDLVVVRQNVAPFIPTLNPKIFITINNV